jgi:P2 family phage contractile tail tube protein
MAIQIPFTLKLWNLFIQGGSWAGRADEIKLPQLSPNFIEHSAGLLVPQPVLVGWKGLVTAEFTLAELSTEIVALVGKESTTLIAKASTGNDEGVTKAESATFTGSISQYSPSSWKSGSKTQDKFTITCTYFKFNGSGGSFEIDTQNNKFSANGEDLVETIRGKINV